MSKSDIIRKRTRVPGSSLAPATISSNSPTKLAVEYVALFELAPYPKGLRKHAERHIAACVASLRAFSFVAPVLVDNYSTIVDGHALIVAAERLGIPEVPVVRVTHLSPEMVKACRVALNKLSEGAEWDQEALQFEMIEIAPDLLANDIEIEALGFSTAEFDLMLSPIQSASEEEEAPTLADDAISSLGDLWLMDGHRLLCGNALHSDDFSKLLDGEKAHMAFCDAPYNLKVDGVISGLGKVKHREFAMGSGEMSRPDFTAFLTGYMQNCAAHSVDGAVHFACMDWRHILELITAGETAFDRFLNLVVWNKTNAGMGTMYRSQHELIAYSNPALPRTGTISVWVTRAATVPMSGRLPVPTHSARAATKTWLYRNCMAREAVAFQLISSPYSARRQTSQGPRRPFLLRLSENGLAAATCPRFDDQSAHCSGNTT